MWSGLTGNDADNIVLPWDLFEPSFQLLDGVRGGGDPVFGGIGLARDGDAHLRPHAGR